MCGSTVSAFVCGLNSGNIEELNILFFVFVLMHFSQQPKRT